MPRFLTLAAIAFATPALAHAGTGMGAEAPVLAVFVSAAAMLFGLLIATRPSHVSIRERIASLGASDATGTVISAAFAAILVLMTLAPGLGLV